MTVFRGGNLGEPHTYRPPGQAKRDPGTITTGRCCCGKVWPQHLKPPATWLWVPAQGRDHSGDYSAGCSTAAFFGAIQKAAGRSNRKLERSASARRQITR